MVENADVVYCIAYLIWNDLFEAVNVRMIPNPTSVTIQEIINLGRKMREVFGSYNITAVDFQNFLQPEKITKILIVVDFEAVKESVEGNNYRVVMENNWSELFIKQFPSTDRLIAFLEQKAPIAQDVEKNYYIQRNSLNYEKIIDRTKKTVAGIMSGAKE